MVGACRHSSRQDKAGVWQVAADADDALR